MKQIYFYDVDKNEPDKKYHGDLYVFPDECPICHKKQEPLFVTAYQVPGNKLEVIFKCHTHHCKSLFIGYYFNTDYLKYNLYRVLPEKPQEIEVSETVNALSPAYKEIFNQSVVAEQEGLHQIAGMGYRKCLEFLIKDYLINFKGLDSEMVSGKFLAKCIGDHIENEKIKALARKTAYIGNDEAHYVRRHEDKDVQYLKKVLDLTVHWIIYEIETEAVLNDGL
ncbi:DUF4145 domain-containing protein [Bacillus sp. FJAT-45037]|uniref:DUF4145 domain-containing protein n=1 Tax=Bacillus sp. FJAT-45037 TaxID=2011007 RepID=UPI000C24C531|nr:DUF4145 domain-containing protein [Bacillus sp. FJAT-45037]